MAGRGARLVLIALRLATVGLVCLLLAQPTFERWQAGKPHLALLIDQSASMDLRVRREPNRTVDSTEPGRGQRLQTDPTRLQQTIDLLTTGTPSLLARLQATFTVDVVLVDDTFEFLPPSDERLVSDRLHALLNRSPPIDMEPWPQPTAAGTGAEQSPTAEEQVEEQPADHRAATRLGDAIDYALCQLPGPGPVAIILLSDGISTRGKPLPSAAQRARDLGVPLYSVAVGQSRATPEIRVAPTISRL